MLLRGTSQPMYKPWIQVRLAGHRDTDGERYLLKAEIGDTEHMDLAI